MSLGPRRLPAWGMSQVEIVHGGVSRVLRNEPRESNSTYGWSRKAKSAPQARTVGPIISAVAEPASTLVLSGQSASSLQLAVVPQSSPQIMGFAGSGLTGSVSGALPLHGTHGSQSVPGSAQSGWARIGVAGRPSATSAAGSSSAVALEPLVATEGGGGGPAWAARAAAKQGEE